VRQCTVGQLAVAKLTGGRTDPLVLNLEIDACLSCVAIGELVSTLARLQPPTRIVVTGKKTREVLGIS